MLVQFILKKGFSIHFLFSLILCVFVLMLRGESTNYLSVDKCVSVCVCSCVVCLLRFQTEKDLESILVVVINIAFVRQQRKWHCISSLAECKKQNSTKNFYCIVIQVEVVRVVHRKEHLTSVRTLFDLKHNKHIVHTCSVATINVSLSPSLLAAVASFFLLRCLVDGFFFSWE